MNKERQSAIAAWLQDPDEDIWYAPDAPSVDPDMQAMLAALRAWILTLTEAEQVILLGFNPRTTCDAEC